jgi:hypothetical protein
VPPLRRVHSGVATTMRIVINDKLAYCGRNCKAIAAALAATRLAKLVISRAALPHRCRRQVFGI